MEERRILIGSPVSKGLAKAKAYHYEPLVLDIEVGCFKPGKETEYWKAFQSARVAVKNDLQLLHEKISASDKNEANIFMVHMMILDDEDLLYDIQNAILKDCMYVEPIVWKQCISFFKRNFFYESFSDIRSIIAI